MPLMLCEKIQLRDLFTRCFVLSCLIGAVCWILSVFIGSISLLIYRLSFVDGSLLNMRR